MTPAPGTDTQLVDAPTPRTTPTDTGVAFFVGEAERGPLTPRLVRSLAEWVAIYGARQAYSPMYDSVEAYFREGGAALWTCRVVSDTSVVATANLSDGAATTLVVSAAGPGTYGNGLKVIVKTNADDASIPAGSFRIRVTQADGSAEESPTFVDKTEALAWAQSNAKTFSLADGAGANDPSRVVAPGTALAGGADNRGAITDAEWQEALDRIPKDLGPGQIAAPGRTTSTIHLALLAHASARNRHAQLDLPDSSSVATVAAAAASANAAPNAGGRFGGAYWPWAVAPGLTTYSTRLVPYSAVQCALNSRVDGKGNPNQAAAGDPDGQTRWVIGVSQDTRSLTDADRQTLNDAGVNVAMLFFGGRGPQTYGNRTLRGFAEDPRWYQASGSRLAMAIRARGDAILGRYVHKQIDGKRELQSALEGELSVMLGRLYDRRALFGNIPADAYAVDAGPTVNTPESIAAGLLKAHVTFRASPGAEHVTLELVRVAVTEAVA